MAACEITTMGDFWEDRAGGQAVLWKEGPAQIPDLLISYNELSVELQKLLFRRKIMKSGLSRLRLSLSLDDSQSRWKQVSHFKSYVIAIYPPSNMYKY